MRPTCQAHDPLGFIPFNFSLRMPLTSLIERFRRGTHGATSGARAPSPSDVDALRTRARRRLIGMIVLVGAAILGFPWLFETQPRPMSADVRILSAAQSGSGAVDVSPRAVTGRVAQVVKISPPASAADEFAEPPRQTKAETQPATPVAPAPKPVLKESPRPVEKAVEKAAAKPAERKKADPKLEVKAAKSDVRYVVQFGAFSDVRAAREVRQKAERMGLKTYAQQVDTAQGKRIRVRLGPFAEKVEAEKALATLRKGGLNGNILTL
jgi:DedD protein